MKRKKLWILPVVVAAVVILVLALQGLPVGKGTEPAEAPGKPNATDQKSTPMDTELPLDDTLPTPVTSQPSVESPSDPSGDPTTQPSAQTPRHQPDASVPFGQDVSADDPAPGLEEDELPIIP